MIDSKQIAARLIRGINDRMLAALDDIVAEDYVQRDPQRPSGRDGLRRSLGDLLQGFPDLEITTHEMLADGDLVAAHVTVRGTHLGQYLGRHPTGRSVSFEVVDFWRVRDGLLVEHWEVADRLSLLAALGAVTLTGEGLAPPTAAGESP